MARDKSVARFDETFEAVIVQWESILECSPDDGGPARDLIEALCAAGVHVFVVSAGAASESDRLLRARPIGPGQLHLAGLGGTEIARVDDHGPIGVHRVPRSLLQPSSSAALRFAATWLSERGITGALVLVVGAELARLVTASDPASIGSGLGRAAVVPEPAASQSGADGSVSSGSNARPTFIDLADDQLARRRAGRVPNIDPDPAWTIALPGDRITTRATEALGTVANGRVGIRGAREEDGPGTAPLFLVSGIYGRDDRLLPGPNWTMLELATHQAQDRRVLDLRTGILVRSNGDGALRTLRLVSSAMPHLMALRAEAVPTGFATSDEPAGPAPEEVRRGPRVADEPLAAAASDDRRIVVRCRERTASSPRRRTIERLAAWAVGGSSDDGRTEAGRELAEAESLGFEAILADHRHEWARRWADAGVVIDGPGRSAGDDQLAARFCVFHLLATVADGDEAAVGARGLTGDAYGGHVFWDADVFVLPALVALRPSAARAMLEYRLRRLPAARAAARALGRDGARFPWESAADGSDVTPPVVSGHPGELDPNATALHEEHIVADVAWAADRYAAWSGDTDFLRGSGRALMTDTARYWASRIRTDQDGHGHIDGVMGPDEYHEVVDDNAYTNVMARWNLRRAAALLEQSGPNPSAASWRRLADDLVDGWSRSRGIYEQFAGYFGLEPLLIANVAVPPVAVDLVLGHDRVAGSQLIKQADVLMLHHLVPDEVRTASLRSCLDFYQPRTAHGSSLSPAVHASLLARAGRADEALEWFRLAARLDLDDRTGTTSAGLHLAAMGGVWQALAHGFLGLSGRGEALQVAPHLPSDWSTLELRFRFRGRRIGIRASHDQVTVTCEEPVLVRIGSRGRVRNCPPPSRTYRLPADPPAGAGAS